MTSALYNRDILRLAASIPHQRRLEAPQAGVMKQSPVCGSRIVDLVTDGEGRVAELGQEVRACALGQAAASLMGARMIQAANARGAWPRRGTGWRNSSPAGATTPAAGPASPSSARRSSCGPPPVDPARLRGRG